jgi:hypothetical protein
LLHAEKAPCRLLPGFPPDVREAAGAELLHVLMLPDFDRADRIAEFWGYPESLRGAFIAIVALTSGFPLVPFGWSGTRRPLP